MAVSPISRRFIVSTLKSRNIHPGKAADYKDDIFKFLLELFKIEEEALEDDKECLDILDKEADYISKSVKSFMNLNNSKPTVRLDRILAPNSNHKVLTLLTHICLLYF